jgi:hypothetical protein
VIAQRERKVVLMDSRQARFRFGCFTCDWVLAVLVAGVVWVGCGEGEHGRREPVVVATELKLRWDILPHRISLFDLKLTEMPGSRMALYAVCDGGEFGLIDVPRVRYAMTTATSSHLVAKQGSASIEIPPGSEVEGEPFSSEATVTLEAGELERAGAMAVFLRGFRISTDEYSEPPGFETDPDIAYDPARGYTSLGVGIRLDRPVVEEGQVEVGVRVRNSLGLSDREDMNDAIPLATTWMRVDFVVVGVVGVDGATSRGLVGYDLGFAEYGTRTDHPHAPPELQEVEVVGEPGLRNGLLGIAGFDIWANQEGRHDSTCQVVQDELNSEGEPVSGPGRYVRELSLRLWDRSYDSASGAGRAKADVYFSNSSEYKEVGNLCMRMEAEVTMLQLDDPAAEIRSHEPVEVELESGVEESVEMDLIGEGS